MPWPAPARQQPPKWQPEPQRALARAPRRQLIFLTSGILELESSEGRRFIARPGDMIFAEDATGRGHITRSLRDTRGFVHVVVPMEFDVSQWPLVTA